VYQITTPVETVTPPNGEQYIQYIPKASGCQCGIDSATFYTMRLLRYTPIFVVVATLAIVACSPERVDEPYRSTGTFTRYRHAIVDLGVSDTPLGRDWIVATDDVLWHDLTVELPFSDTRIFDPAEPKAAGYRFTTSRNRTISVRLTSDERSPIFFADIYRLSTNADSDPVKVASLDPGSDTIAFRARRPATYLLRVIPELGRGGRVRIDVDST
jgi:hypothetical protein